MSDADRCVCCGEIIPEGRQVCPQCERSGHKIYNIDYGSTEFEVVGNIYDNPELSGGKEDDLG